MPFLRFNRVTGPNRSTGFIFRNGRTLGSISVL